MNVNVNVCRCSSRRNPQSRIVHETSGSASREALYLPAGAASLLQGGQLLVMDILPMLMATCRLRA